MAEKDKRADAKVLFMAGMPQKRIALILKTAEATISRWAKEDDWDDERDEASQFKTSSLANVRRLINHNLNVLTRISELNEAAIENSKTPKELQALLIERGDVDALQKLFSTIKGKELEWDMLIRTVTEFTEYIEALNSDLAKQITPYANDFIHEKR